MNKALFIRNALLASLFLAPAITVHASEIDIVGLKLGMSVEEAEKLIQTYNPELKLGRTQYYMNYTDGVKKLRTDDYVRMVTTAPHRVDSFLVTFAAPPDKPEVLAFQRIQRIRDAPVKRAVYLDALTDKYGAPSLQVTDPRSNFMFIQWYLGEGKVNCQPPRVQPGPRVGVDVSLQRSIVREIRNNDGSMKLPEAKSIEDCAVVLEYRLEGDPVVRAAGSVVNVEAAAKNELNVAAWMEDLTRKAQEDLAKKSGTAKPKI
ncbi:MAG: hypothetical protein EP348_11590 [Alphaproteobacteria bacterium]|nr:MAG: hypothetical protein EP348_11590 [Alphaproteobacteria bacterium]